VASISGVLSRSLSCAQSTDQLAPVYQSGCSEALSLESIGFVNLRKAHALASSLKATPSSRTLRNASGFVLLNSYIYIHIYTHTHICILFEQIELPAKLLDYFLWSNEGNINDIYIDIFYCVCVCVCVSVCLSVCVSVCAYMFVCVFASVRVGLIVCVCAYMRVCVCVLGVCFCVWVYVCVWAVHLLQPPGLSNLFN